MTRLLEGILAGIRVLLGAALFFAVVLICANAFGRYVLSKPIIFAEEVLGYLLVWMVYLGAVQVTWDGTHLKMDLVSKGATRRWKLALDIAAAVSFIACGALIIYQSFTSIAGLTHRSLVADLPMNVVHGVIPVAFAIMIVVVIVRLFAGRSAA